MYGGGTLDVHLLVICHLVYSLPFSLQLTQLKIAATNFFNLLLLFST